MLRHVARLPRDVGDLFRCVLSCFFCGICYVAGLDTNKYIENLLLPQEQLVLFHLHTPLTQYVFAISQSTPHEKAKYALQSVQSDQKHCVCTPDTCGICACTRLCCSSVREHNIGVDEA